MENLISMLFYAQQEVYKDYTSSKETKDAFELSYVTAKELIAEFKDNEILKKLYYKSDEAKNLYTVRVEEDAYCFGFKTGFKLATELGLFKL